MKYFLSVLTLALVLSSCVSSYKEYKFDNTYKTTQEYNLIIQRSIDYFGALGLIVSSIDKQYGIINVEGDALKLQSKSWSNWSGRSIDFLLSDCGTLDGSQSIGDKVKININIQQSSGGNTIRAIVNFERTLGNNFACTSTGELEKQYFHFIETGEILPFPEFKTDAQRKKEAVQKKIDADREKNWGK